MGDLLELPARAILTRENQFAEEVLVVEAGVVMLSKTLAEDRRQVVGFRFSDELIALGGSLAICSVTLEALTASRLRRISKEGLNRVLAEEPGSCRWLLDQAGDEIAATQGQLLTVGRRNKEERLAAFLLEMWYRTGGAGSKPPEVVLPMHRLEIADYLGLTTETISRVFGQFIRERLIALPNPNHVRLLEPNALEQLALGLGDDHRGLGATAARLDLDQG